MNTRRLRSAALALLVVLAGCSAPTSLSDSPTEEPDAGDGSVGDLPGITATPPGVGHPAAGTPDGGPQVDDDVRVTDGDLAVDEDLLFARVERLLGEDVEPGTVYLRDLSAGKGSASAFSPVHGYLGVDAVQLDPDQPAGLTRSGGNVYFDTQGAGEDAVERRLVHEYVHVAQFTEGWIRTPRAYDVELTRDFELAWRAVAEGGAVYVADAYIERHMPGGRSQSAELAAQYEQADPAGTRIVLAPYHFGSRWVRAQVDSPSELGTAYDTIPRTTEQVLHNETPAGEPPMDLDVDVETGSTFDDLRMDRKGELLLRAVLRAELDRERAAEAAAGWGTDRWVSFTSADTGEWSLAWVTRWDTGRDADEFEQAAETFVDRRRPDTEASFRVVRLSPEVVVLLAGEEAFLKATTVRGGGDRVEVTVDAGAAAAGLGGEAAPSAHRTAPGHRPGLAAGLLVDRGRGGGG